MAPITRILSRVEKRENKVRLGRRLMPEKATWAELEGGKVSSPLSLLDLEVNVVQRSLAVVSKVEMGDIDGEKIGRVGGGGHAEKERG